MKIIMGRHRLEDRNIRPHGVRQIGYNKHKLMAFSAKSLLRTLLMMTFGIAALGITNLVFSDSNHCVRVRCCVRLRLMHATCKLQIDEFSDGCDRRMAASERISHGRAPGK